MTTEFEHPGIVKVHLVKDSTPVPKEKPCKEIVTALNTFPMSVGMTPVMILPHAPKRKHAEIVVNGTGVVAFGRSQSDCQAAQSNAAGESTGNVFTINGAEFTASHTIRGNSELWATLISASDPLATVTYPAINAPAFPATGVAVQNTNNSPITVVIGANGATITNVTVNGTTVGTGAGTYIVPAAGTISVAYTVATPTWTWAITVPPVATTVIPTTVSVSKETETG